MNSFTGQRSPLTNKCRAQARAAMHQLASNTNFRLLMLTYRLTHVKHPRALAASRPHSSRAPRGQVPARGATNASACFHSVRAAGDEMRLIFLVAILLGGAAVFAGAEVRLPAIFGDHMVLQHKTPIRVWGWAEAGEAITVTLAGGVRANEGGRQRALAGGPAGAGGGGGRSTWRSRGGTPSSSAMCWSGRCGCARGSRTCSGRSIASRTSPRSWLRRIIRCCACSTSRAPPRRSRRSDVKAQWAVCTPASVNMFSGIGYFFRARVAADPGRARGHDQRLLLGRRRRGVDGPGLAPG